MTVRHPIVGITGSSGAGTSTALRVFSRVAEQLALKTTVIEGDAFHAHDREGNSRAMERARIRGENYSLFGPSHNLLDRLNRLLTEYGRRGTGHTRHYLHLEAEADSWGQPVGTFTPWEALPRGTDMLFYEGLHGGWKGDEIDIATHMDLLVGVVPIINLEWIQKIRRDTNERGVRPEEVTGTILRRMPDYVNHIAPQFSRTDVNFQRVPLVDTSNPFVIREIPKNEESLVVIHFNENARISRDLDAYQAQIPWAFKSNAQTLVIPGVQMESAMEVIFKPAIEALLQRRAAVLGEDAPGVLPGF